MRVRQEIMLGIGGIRALEALGLDADRLPHERRALGVFGVERIRGLMETRPLVRRGRGGHQRRQLIFTTHTPVPAGNDMFPPP